MAAFWILLYTLLLTLVRKYGAEPPLTSDPTADKGKEKEGEKAKKKPSLTILGCPCGLLTKCIPAGPKLDGIRRFAYRAGRIFVFVNFWLVVGITASVTMRAVSDTPGTGLYSEYRASAVKAIMGRARRQSRMTRVALTVIVLYVMIVLLLLVALIELSNEERKYRKLLLTRDWRMLVMCKCWCCCAARERPGDVETGNEVVDRRRI